MVNIKLGRREGAVSSAAKLVTSKAGDNSRSSARGVARKIGGLAAAANWAVVRLFFVGPDVPPLFLVSGSILISVWVFAAVFAAVTLLRPVLGAGPNPERAFVRPRGFGLSVVLVLVLVWPGLEAFACALEG